MLDSRLALDGKSDLTFALGKGSPPFLAEYLEAKGWKRIEVEGGADDNEADEDDDSGDDNPKVPSSSSSKAGSLSAPPKKKKPPVYPPCPVTFQWEIKAKNINYSHIPPEQIINVFRLAYNLTSKKCLSQNIYGVRMMDACKNVFYPQTYALTDGELGAFARAFRCNFAVSLLRRFHVDQGDSASNNGSSAPASLYLLTLALVASERHLRDIISPMEDEATVQLTASKSSSGPKPLELGLTDAEWQELVQHSDATAKGPRFTCRNADMTMSEMGLADSKKTARRTLPARSAAAGTPLSSKTHTPLTEAELHERIETLLTALRSADPQYDLFGSDNIWILKPGSLSRGRGIQCMDSLTSIAKYI